MAALAQATADMIEAGIAASSAGAFKRVEERARQLAGAAAENRLRARLQDPWRWRRATLLWPLFTKD